MSEKKIKVTGSQAILMSLLEEGVDTVFGYPGGQIIPVYDALYDYREKINHVLVRHEQGAAHAAEGYARITNSVGVCIVTSGPGATNLITGLANALVDSVPIVCISGQVSGSLLGSDAFQEIDVMGITMPVTKWNYQITSAEEIPEIMARAFYLARTGRPGPVMIDLTKNAQVETLDFSYSKCDKLRSYFPYPKIRKEDIEAAAILINNSQRPLLLAGHGILISDACDELKELVEKADIPVAMTLLGLSGFPSDHRLFTGMLGMHGNYAPNIKTNECDLLIAVGMRFDDRITGNIQEYARQATIIHIEIDQSEINKNIESDLPINADAKDALSALIPRVRKNDHSKWLNSFSYYEEQEYSKVIHKSINGDGNDIRMEEVVHMISEMTGGKAVIVTDVGQNQMVSARNYRFTETNSFLTSGGLGTMGYGLPAAIGAKTACPGKEVIAISGDGGFQMTLQELGTIAQSGIAVKMVILNNRFLGMVRQWQDLFFNKRYSFTEMHNPDFIKLASAYGIKGTRISERENLRAAIEEMLNTDGPCLLEVMVGKETNIFPMIPAGESVSSIRFE